jgi:hypothetical protein
LVARTVTGSNHRWDSNRIYAWLKEVLQKAAALRSSHLTGPAPGRAPARPATGWTSEMRNTGIAYETVTSLSFEEAVARCRPGILS